MVLRYWQVQSEGGTSQSNFVTEDMARFVAGVLSMDYQRVYRVIEKEVRITNSEGES